jgi:hypothetical protein
MQNSIVVPPLIEIKIGFGIRRGKDAYERPVHEHLQNRDPADFHPFHHPLKGNPPDLT